MWKRYLPHGVYNFIRPHDPSKPLLKSKQLPTKNYKTPMIETGQIVQVRTRQYLVEEVVNPPSPGQDTKVSLSCLEDDALGEPLEILWEKEIDAKIVERTSWNTIAHRGFDDPHLFSAYLHTLRWNCVTSTDATLFQAPYRAGIEVKAYQLEPLRKALLMPRVNLFIADDVGLGKTIEAGLILREMLMRQKVKRVVISCPAGVTRQWLEEMENRFGLTFVILNREFIIARRQERGYGINPWTTHTRFIISHTLLREETYAAPLRDWLGDFCPKAMFILDEAHHAAPASGAKYAVDSQLTKTVRELARRFEHKLFLSATPHNGHSNSFAALLEILDPQRFCRGVPVRDLKLLDTVMVRRLKQDLRDIGEEFPQRHVTPIIIDNLPDNAPEIQLSQWLQQYRHLREARLKNATKSAQTNAILIITSLQKRLLSSIEAFARTLKVHQSAIEKQTTPSVSTEQTHLSLLIETPGADDERADLPEEEVEKEEETQMILASQQNCQPTPEELAILTTMTNIANRYRHEPDPRIKRLVAWIRTHLCPELGQTDAAWLNRRVIIFTEYTDTKTYLHQQLQAAIAHSNRANQRIETFHGGMGEERQEAIKAAFNSDPARHPLRILIATDAAREGVNLQNYCADLFHFDIPWNPSRMEQRNGRIDRKLQRCPIVNCYYFIFPQRAEDKVLDILVKKTTTIQQELGSLAPVVQKNVSYLLANGIHHHQINHLTHSINNIEQHHQNSHNKQTINLELEQGRLRQQQLSQQIQHLQLMLKNARDWLKLNDLHFREAISAALEILGVSSLKPLDINEVAKNPLTARWLIPPLDQHTGADPTWATTLDSLRTPRKIGQKPWEWRKQTPPRPVVFRDLGTLDSEVVHLHLEHRLVQRLLSRFLAQGFLHNELTRACICFTDDPVPKVIALGRLALYGEGASRLHDEIIAIAASWTDNPSPGKKRLQILKQTEKDKVLDLLETSIASPQSPPIPPGVKQRLQNSAPQDIAELIPHLQHQAQILKQNAEKKLTQRGLKEAGEMKKILQQQQQQILKCQQESQVLQLSLLEEKRQQEADRRHWEKRLETIATEMTSEPARIESAYKVKATRVEPVGLTYLYPISG